MQKWQPWLGKLELEPIHLIKTHSHTYDRQLCRWVFVNIPKEGILCMHVDKWNKT
jgi:hypothetical protein